MRVLIATPALARTMFIAQARRRFDRSACIEQAQAVLSAQLADPGEAGGGRQGKAERIEFRWKRGEQRIIVATGCCEQPRGPVLSAFGDEGARQGNRVEVDLGPASARLAHPAEVEQQAVG